MKHAVSILLLIGLIAIPIGCVLAICPAVDHDCCPKSASTATACPYDILSTSSAACTSPALTLHAVVTAMPAAPVVSIAPVAPTLSLVSDTGDLHIVNRVLLI